MELKYERFFASRAGIERRHPLRHQRILETVLSCPSYLFFDDDQEKVLTREAMAGLLPDSVLHAPHGGNLNGLFMQGCFQTGLPAIQTLLSRRAAFWPEIIRHSLVSDAVSAGLRATVEQQNIVLAAAGIELWRIALERR